MKSTTILILAVGAVGVSAIAVMALRKAPSHAGSQNPAGNANQAGWAALISPVAGLASQGLQIFGSAGSPKPTTPAQLSASGNYWSGNLGVNLPNQNADPKNFIYS